MFMPSTLPLEAPAAYFPLASGRYEVKTGLHPFGSDFGNGPADALVFQLDREFARYRATKIAARAERLSKYYVEHAYEPAVARAVANFLVNRLVAEHPQWFVLQRISPAQGWLGCTLTGEALLFDSDMNLIDMQAHESAHPPYVSILDALACQIAEDLAVISLAGGHRHWLSALHLCYPNRWAAEDKIGGDFAALHGPVPGMEKINARSQALIDAMVHRGPYVRFAWGLSADAHLNQHPRPPSAIATSTPCELIFNRARPKLVLRVERQVLWGLPHVGAALFTIRTYLTDCRHIKRDSQRLASLVSAVASMNDEELAYKGLARSRDEILAWLADGYQPELRLMRRTSCESSSSSRRRCRSRCSRSSPRRQKIKKA